MLTIVIQAGGESRRMGQDKALLPFLGRPLVARIVARFRPIADEILVTTNRPEAYQFLGLPLYTDLLPGRGALGGVYTALELAKNPCVAIIACDMPFASPALVSAEQGILLANQNDLVIPHSGEGLEPFHAVYRRESCLPAIQAALQAGKWRVDAWFSQVKVQILQREDILPYDPLGLCFQNVNTPEELQAAEALAQQIE
jgi:molybdopterin-guanine dinucleotide biosynthesis protein A